MNTGPAADADIQFQHVDWDRALRALDANPDDGAMAVRGLD